MDATFYRCLTGELPQASIDRIFNDRVLELRAKAYNLVPETAINAILKAMSINEAGRFQNMTDFKEALTHKITEYKYMEPQQCFEVLYGVDARVKKIMRSVKH